ncbi:hypothetical protein ACIBF7_40895 [Nonomuraea sp. NPDC050478]|uniref:hypothetical protein n=1 Tax=Nonomuraea sp. NPDC050478 TaxID=3364365 RepID=UPI0037945D7F
MVDLSLPDAWNLWLSGRSISDMTLWGIPTIWWGRGGKVLSFLAAATVILDIIGPETLKAYAQRAREKDKTWNDHPLYSTKPRRTIGCLALFIVPPIIIAMLANPDVVQAIHPLLYEQILFWISIAGMGFVYVYNFKRYIVESVALFAGLLEHRRFAAVVRILGFTALAIGFHFDLLAT